MRVLIRGLWRTPGLTLTAMAAVALAVGSAAAVFSVVDRILYRPLPYAQSERLAWIGMRTPLDPQEFLLGPDYLDWREKQNVFERMTSSGGVQECDLLEANPAKLRCGRAEWSLLETLGLRPAAGRDLTREDDRPGTGPAALISYAMWQSRFGGDSGVLGRTMKIDGNETRIVGVLPREFEYPSLAKVDVLLPQQLNEAEQRRRDRMAMLAVFGRLKPGVTVEQAREGLKGLFDESLKQVPAGFRKEVHLVVSGLRERQVRDQKAAAQLLMGAVLCVLLIACANVANLELARAAARRQEAAVRSALGASRGRLVREALARSVALAGIGGLLGTGLAVVLVKTVRATAPEGIVRLKDAAVDVRVLLFAVGVTLAAGVLAGLAPAWMRIGVEDLSGSRATDRRLGWLKPMLVAGQVAVTVVLLAGAGVLLESLWKVQSVALGLRTSRVLTAEMRVEATRAIEIRERLRRLPGVEEVALSDSMPPVGRSAAMIFSRIEVEARETPARSGTGGMVTWRTVTPDYFPALGVRMVRGRVFGGEEKNAVVISESLAARLLGQEDALGRRIRAGRENEWMTVVGIAANVKNNRPEAPDDPEYYVPRVRTADAAQRRVFAIVRGTGAASAMAQMVRAEIRQTDPTLPVTLEQLDDRVAKLYQRPRLQALVLSAFAGTGVLLASIGLFGVVSFFVAQRRREIGVRLCLGSTPGGIVALVTGRAMRWTLGGAAVGVCMAAWVGKWVEALLFQTRARSPQVLALAAGLMAGVALIAALAPGWRASRVDPMEALRAE